MMGSNDGGQLHTGPSRCRRRGQDHDVRHRQGVRQRVQVAIMARFVAARLSLGALKQTLQVLKVSVVVKVGGVVMVRVVGLGFASGWWRGSDTRGWGRGGRRRGHHDGIFLRPLLLLLRLLMM